MKDGPEKILETANEAGHPAVEADRTSRLHPTSTNSPGLEPTR